MVAQLKQAQQKENRTPSELVRAAWRQYFESKYDSYSTTKTEVSAIHQGRAEIKRGESKTLQELRSGLDNSHRKTRRKTARKSAR